VTPLVYSSLEAFLAHFRALRGATNLDANDRGLLTAMDHAIDTLTPADRAALTDTSPDPSITRRRQRAERSLRQILAGEGVLRS
jgi:hypothetical protein